MGTMLCDVVVVVAVSAREPYAADENVHEKINARVL